MSDKLKTKVMEQIRANKVKMKSKWLYIAKSIGLKSGLGLSFVLLVFFINAFFFYIKANGLLLPLHYGPSTWQEILHSLPYDVILIILVLVLFLNYIIKKFDFSYSHPFVIIFSGVILFAFFWATVLFASNFNYTVQNMLLESKTDVPFFSDFYTRRCGMMMNENPTSNGGGGCMMNNFGPGR